MNAAADGEAALRPAAGVMFALCAAALLLKSPDAFGNPQFWAEDGAVFFQQQPAGAAPAWLQPYAGYLHLLPRLVAWLATFAPLAVVPAVYAYLSLAVNAACVASLAQRLLPSKLALAALAGVLLVPTSGEVFGTLTNSQWFLQLFLLAWCFLPGGPRHGALRVALALAVLVAALTGPFSLLLAVLHALALVVALAWRDLRPWLGAIAADGGRERLAALWLGAAAQAVFLARAPQVAGGSLALDVRLEALGRWTQGHLFDAAPLPGWLFLGLLAAMAGFVLLRPRPDADRVTAPFLGLVLALAAAEVVLAAGKADVVGMDLGYGDRYFVLFKLAFWLLAFDAARAWRWRRGHGGAVALAALLAVSLQHHDHLQRAALPDKHWRSAIAPAERGESVVVPINPEPWTVTVHPRKPSP